MKHLVVLLSGLIFLWSCSKSPEPIRLGVESCSHCKMTIMDPKFAAELITQKGKIYKFDSIECLLGFHNEAALKPADIHSLWVADFTHPERFLRAEKAVYLHSQQLKSPMGLNVAAFADEAAAKQAQQRVQGTVLLWGEVQNLVPTKAHRGPESE